VLPTPTYGSVSNNWMGTAAGRFGFADGPWLVYGKVGAGWIQREASLRTAGTVWQGENTSAGLLIGGGLEYGFKPHWTVRLDYNYFALPAWSSPTAPSFALGRNVQMVTAGISYKFDSGVSETANDVPEHAATETSEDLAKKAQNPIADLVSVPFQSNTNFNAGPFDRAQEVFNIQPVVPMHITDDWNIISRTIIPLISQPDPVFDNNSNGIGDITQSLFFSPVNSGAVIWGAGPVFTVPSATNPFLGTGHFLVGPTGVIVITPGHWLIGALVNNQWSVDGNPLRPSVNSFLAQPFVNYNMPHGWYLTSSPIITANWLAPSGQKWTVPLGGGFGRVFRLGDQPVNAQLSSYYNVVNPNGAPNWQIRATLALLFPVK
jgi:hypothetical protein